MDVGQDATLSDGNSREELVELLVVADSELNVAGSDALLLVVAASVSGKLQDLGAEVFHDGGKIHGATLANAGAELCLSTP